MAIFCLLQCVAVCCRGMHIRLARSTAVSYEALGTSAGIFWHAPRPLSQEHPILYEKRPMYVYEGRMDALEKEFFIYEKRPTYMKIDPKTHLCISQATCIYTQ